MRARIKVVVIGIVVIVGASEYLWLSCAEIPKPYRNNKKRLEVKTEIKILMLWGFGGEAEEMEKRMNATILVYSRK